MAEDEEAILQRHKKELKEFQAKTTALKKSAPVSDKKRRKEVLAEIEAMEKELSDRHEQELSQFKNGSNNLDNLAEPSGDSVENNDKIAENLADLQIESADVDDDEKMTTEGAKKMSRAQRRRVNKQTKQTELKKDVKVEEGPVQISSRTTERLKIRKVLDENGLKLVDMPSDGNCLYYSLSHQLKLNGTEKSMQELRRAAGEFMLNHPDDFKPFLVHHETGDSFSTADFENYCKDIINTNAWGSHIELKALATVLKSAIRVLQAEGPAVFVGEEFLNDVDIPLTIVYHRHELSLGEHYNSVVPA